jgi:uncharacterized protein with GYD domain
MPTYILLMNYTDKSIQAVHQPPRDAAKKMLEDVHVKSVCSARGALAPLRKRTVA